MGLHTTTVESLNLDVGEDADCDFTLDTANFDPRGIWSDGPTMYVVDANDNKVYTYVNPCPPPEPGLILSASSLDISEADINVSDTYTVRLDEGAYGQCDSNFGPAVEHRRDCGYGFW